MATYQDSGFDPAPHSPHDSIQEVCCLTGVKRCTMARITVIPDDSWGAALGEMHPRLVDRTYGRVDNILAIHSLNPRSMAAHQGLYESAMASTATLRKAERELIALVLSLTNDCHY